MKYNAFDNTKNFKETFMSIVENHYAIDFKD